VTRLLILAGPPASGKTCFARGLARTLRGDGWDVAHVEADAIRGFLWQGEFKPRLEKVARRAFLRVVETLLEEELDLVIADDTNYYASMRRELAKLALEREAPWGIVWLDVPLRECLRRNAERGRPVPDEVVKRLHERFEPPDPDRWWERRALRLDDAEVTEEVLEFVRSGLEVQRPRREGRERRPTPESVDEVDQATRKVMGEIMRRAAEEGTASQELGEVLSRIRREIVSECDDPEEAVERFRERAEEVLRKWSGGD